MQSAVPGVMSINRLRSEIAGLNQKVALLDGSELAYVHLDHAACTPAFRAVVEKMGKCLEWYGDTQYGSGQRAEASRLIYTRSAEKTLAFIAADPDEDSVYYGKNTSEVLDVLARCIRWEPGDVVLTTELNAVASEMPWLGKAQVVYAGMDEDGFFDLGDLEKKLIKFAGRVKLVAVNGAGMLNGAIPPVHAAAELVHNFRAMILAECGQVAAHRLIRKNLPDSESGIDFITLSGQKMYAPVGIAALIGGKRHLDRVIEKYGTPNVAGAAALAASMDILSHAGLGDIVRHEARLSSYAYHRLQRIPGCTIASGCEPTRLEDRLGYLSFGMEDIPPAQLAAMLAYEAGVGIGRVEMKIPARSQEIWPQQPHRVGDRLNIREVGAGWVRASFGCYNNEEDIDRLADGLERIARGEIRGEYESGADGRYLPHGYNPAVLERRLPL